LPQPRLGAGIQYVFGLASGGMAKRRREGGLLTGGTGKTRAVGGKQVPERQAWGTAGGIAEEIKT